MSLAPSPIAATKGLVFMEWRKSIIHAIELLDNQSSSFKDDMHRLKSLVEEKKYGDLSFLDYEYFVKKSMDLNRNKSHQEAFSILLMTGKQSIHNSVSMIGAVADDSCDYRGNEFQLIGLGHIHDITDNHSLKQFTPYIISKSADEWRSSFAEFHTHENPCLQPGFMEFSLRFHELWSNVCGHNSHMMMRDDELRHWHVYIEQMNVKEHLACLRFNESTMGLERLTMRIAKSSESLRYDMMARLATALCETPSDHGDELMRILAS